MMIDSNLLHIFIRVQGKSLVRSLQYLIAAAFIFIITGCSQVDDVSHNLQYWGGYQKDQKYVLKQDLFLLEVESEVARYALVPEGNYPGKVRPHYNRPMSVVDYQQNNRTEIYKARASQVPVKVVTVIKAGTVIRPVRAKYFRFRNWSLGTVEYVRIFGQLNDFAFGNIDIDMEDISIRDSGDSSSCCWNHAPNEDLIGPVGTDGGQFIEALDLLRPSISH